MADSLAIGLRALAYASALLAAGLPIFLALFGRELVHCRHRLRAAAVATALAGFGLTAAHALAEPARLTGELSGILDPGLQAMLLGASFGTAAAVRLFGLALIAATGLWPRRTGEWPGLLGAALVVSSFAVTGHTAAEAQRWLLAPLLLLHLAAVAFWIGALWPLLAVTRHEPAAAAGAIIARFSRLALWIVPVILVAGIALAAGLLPDLAALATPYGRLLTVKLGGFVALMGLAALNRWRFGPGIARGEPAAAAAFTRTVMAEFGLLLGIVTATAVMTALYSPGH